MLSTETLLGSNMAPPPSGSDAASLLETHLGYWLRAISNQVSGNFARGLQERQASVAEWVALNQIAVMSDATPASLADAMGMTRGAITKVLDKLEAKRWVTRTASNDDKRMQFLTLTKPGKAILPTLTDIADKNDQQFFGVLSATERTQLRGLLQKLARIHHIKDVAVD
jgi:DNA-binding MarR family transcriptional regulator